MSITRVNPEYQPIGNYAAANHTHTPASIGAAAASHGNHVPAVQTASNSKFLRNDNTWQTVTPANIGAAKSSWTLVNTVTGTATVTLPSAWNEVFVLVTLYDDNQSWLSIPKAALYGSRSIYHLAAFGGAVYGSVKILGNNVTLMTYIFNGTEQKASSRVAVYYR